MRADYVVEKYFPTCRKICKWAHFVATVKGYKMSLFADFSARANITTSQVDTYVVSCIDIKPIKVYFIAIGQ